MISIKFNTKKVIVVGIKTSFVKFGQFLAYKNLAHCHELESVSNTNHACVLPSHKYLSHHECICIIYVYKFTV